MRPPCAISRKKHEFLFLCVLAQAGLAAFVASVVRERLASWRCGDAGVQLPGGERLPRLRL